MMSITDFIKDTIGKIVVGVFEISELKDGSIYIERRDDGEGMSIDSQKLEKLIWDFYEENF